MQFTEKYRPKTLKDFYGNESTVSTLQGYIENDCIPHAILFYGQCGTGKSTLAYILANEIKAKKMTDIEVLGTAKYKKFGSKLAWSMFERTIYTNIYQATIFILNEAHSMTRGQQESILEPMEQSNRGYFLLTSTEPRRLIDPIRSRCQLFYIEPLGKEVMTQLVYRIFNREEVEPTTETVAKVVEGSKGIARHAVQLIEKTILIKNGGYENES